MRERLEDTGPRARAYVWGGVSDLFGRDLVGCAWDRFLGGGVRSEGALILQELGELVLLDDESIVIEMSNSKPCFANSITQGCGGAE